jgi:hypothetical protein
MRGQSPDTHRLYAWLSRDVRGAESIVSLPSPGRDPILMVFADRERALHFRNDVQASCRARGRAAKLVVFDRSHVLDEVYPVEGNPRAQRAF